MRAASYSIHPRLPPVRSGLLRHKIRAHATSVGTKIRAPAFSMLATTLFMVDDTQGRSVPRITTTANMAATTTTHGASRPSHSQSRCKMVPSIPCKLVSVTLRVLKASAPSYARIPLTLDLSAHPHSVSLLRPCICSTPLLPALLTRSSVNPTLGTAPYACPLQHTHPPSPATQIRVRTSSRSLEPSIPRPPPTQYPQTPRPSALMSTLPLLSSCAHAHHFDATHIRS